MNKEQAKGQLKKITGTIKTNLGELTEDEQLQTEGHAKYLEGQAQESYGNFKDVAFKKINSLIKAIEKKFKKE